MSEEAHFFFCRPIKEGVIFASHFTSIISMIACALAFAAFFRESTPDDGDSKLLAFSIACYTIIYIFMSRNLLHGIKEERRDKFVCWIIMSVVTLVCFVSGIILVIAFLINGEFQESYSITFIVLATTILCLFLTGILTYCIWGVVTLWKLYGVRGGEVDVQGAVV